MSFLHKSMFIIYLHFSMQSQYEHVIEFHVLLLNEGYELYI